MLPEDYAWNWFKYHAEQRLLAFRFYLVIVGTLVAAIAVGVRADQMILISGACLLGFVITVFFYFLELRNRELMHRGRLALCEVEQIFSEERREANKKVLMHLNFCGKEFDQEVTADRPVAENTTHTSIFKLFYRLLVVAFALGLFGSVIVVVMPE